MSNSEIIDNIVNLRKLWTSSTKKNKSFHINSLSPQESLILINRYSAAKRLTPIGLTVKFDLAIGCIANCIMCTTRKPSGETYKRIKSLLDYIEFPIVSRISLVEGEPLMDKTGLIEFIKECYKKSLRVSVTTNAFLLSEEYTDMMVKSGLDDIVISLDSYTEQEHDKIRGVEGIFCSAINSIKYFKKKHPQVRVSINSVIMRNNLSSVLGIINLANVLEVNGLNIIYVIDKGKNFKELSLTAKDKLKLEKIKNSRIVSCSKVPISWDLCNPMKKTGCGNRYYHFVVKESGEIVFCSSYGKRKHLLLNKPLKELFLEKDFYDYFLSDKFHCISGKII